MKKTNKKKVVKKERAFGILNQFGDFWTNNTFDTKEEAFQYMKDFWRKNPNPPSMEKHQVVPVTITFTPSLPRK